MEVLEIETGFLKLIAPPFIFNPVYAPTGADAVINCERIQTLPAGKT